MKIFKILILGLILSTSIANAQSEKVYIDGYEFYVNEYDLREKEKYVVKYMRTIISGLKAANGEKIDMKDCDKYFEQKEKAFKYLLKFDDKKMVAWRYSKYSEGYPKENEDITFKEFIENYRWFLRQSEKIEKRCYDKMFIENGGDIDRPKH